MNTLQTALGVLLGGVAVGLWSWWQSRQARSAGVAVVADIQQQDRQAQLRARVMVDTAVVQQLEGQVVAAAAHEKVFVVAARQEGLLDVLADRPDALAAAAEQAYGEKTP